MTAPDRYEQRLQDFVGRELVGITEGPDPVNTPMIRHWTEAMGTLSPVHRDAEAARATGRDGIVAPASMAQVWTMRGYAPAAASTSARQGFLDLVALLEEGGYTSVVATDSECAYVRELVPGDRIGLQEVVESISPRKRTALGEGRFVTTFRTYRDQRGETVATQRWRTLRFRPRQSAEPAPRAQPAPGPDAQRPQKPRPAVNADNAFWFEAAQAHRLVVQRCTRCSTLRHPTGPCCPQCNSFDWDTVEASGRGHVHSFVVNHHPRHPAFDYPLVVALVELAEGTRLITRLTGIAPDDVTIDLPVVLDWDDSDPAHPLPVFRPDTPDTPTGRKAPGQEEDH